MTQWEERITRCDECRRQMSQQDSGRTERPPLPEPWREVVIKGWVGTFHVCSDACEVGLRARVGRGEEPRSGKPLVPDA
jgi:hypothetical protein